MALSSEVLLHLSRVRQPEKYESLTQLLQNSAKFDSNIKRPTTRNWLDKVSKGNQHNIRMNKI
jgi:hypothetical protein